MSFECAWAARLRAGPTRSGATPFAARYELINWTTVSSPRPSAEPFDESGFNGTTESASARAPTLSDTPSKSTMTLRMRQFPDIRKFRRIVVDDDTV
jgi:hypothetical protein